MKARGAAASKSGRMQPGTGLVPFWFLLGLLGLLWAVPAGAAPVGRFILVEGEVEVLPQSRPPAKAVKVQDEVFKGDQVRTRVQSRAQVRFVDDTVVTISPSSSVIIEDYWFDPGKGFREAVLHLLRGLSYTVVNRILQTEKPDFLLKTQTAVFGVRGTKIFTLAGVRYSGHYLEEGEGEVQSLVVPSALRLRSMEFAVAEVGKALVKGILTLADLALLRQWLLQGVPAQILTGPPPFPGALQGPGKPEGPGGPAAPKELEKGLFVPPTVAPPPPPSPSRPRSP